MRKSEECRKKSAMIKICMAFTMVGVLSAGVMTGCGTGEEGKFEVEREISLVSREDGSGTRGAFVELFGVEQKDSSGRKVDMTTTEANVTNSTSVMMTTVEGYRYAIGYISLGSLNDTVKAVKIDGAEATVENIKSGIYKIARPFNIAVKGDLSKVAQDFVDYILSADGQKVIENSGYIAVSDKEAYSGSKPSGKIVIAGSSSVTPVMEKVKEAYLKVNTNASIEIQESDSTTGMMSTAEGICDIGMASREIKDSEKGQGLSATEIAMDGIVVIVNKESPVEEISSEDVLKVYTGESTVWSDIVTETEETKE